jgi:hypothetical protein
VGANRRVAEALEREKNAMLMSGYGVGAAHDESSTSQQGLYHASVSSSSSSSIHQDLDDFMRECTHELESYVRDLQSLYDAAEKCCDKYESRAMQVKAQCVHEEKRVRLRQAPATVDEHAGAVVNEDDDDFDRILSSAHHRRKHEEELRQNLKRKYASSILSLKSEFMKKRRKGKLPDDSTDVLKAWWAENIVWPYPSEDDKRALIEQTGLDATQVNNWFINFRKRHWIKLFPNGAPNCQEESFRLLQKAFGGSMEKAKQYARSL